MRKKRRIIRKAAALLALMGVFTSQVFAASLVETASATYFSEGLRQRLELGGPRGKGVPRD